MLAAYKSSQELLVEQRTTLGDTHPIVGTTQASEVLHLTRLFRSTPPDRSDITSLLQFVRNDISRAFTNEQHVSIIEAASVRLASTADGDPDAALMGELHGGQKIQTHMFSYNYNTDDDWSYYGGTATPQQKFNRMSKTWLRWGLRYPSGPTSRIGVSSIFVATEWTVPATQAHELYLEFTIEFRTIRELNPGEPTLKTFPSAATAFAVLYPDLLGDVVPCRVDVQLVREAAVSDRIPLKRTNRKLTSKRASAVATPSPKKTPREQVLQSLLESVMGQHAPTPSPAHDHRAQSQLVASLVADRRIEPRPHVEPPAPIAPVGVNTECGQAVVGTVARPDERPSLGPDAQIDGVQARRARLDDMSALVGSYLDGKKTAAKKAKATSKKPACKPDGSSSDESSSDEDESTVAQAPGKSKPKANVAAKKLAAKTVAAKAPPVTKKRPSAVDTETSSKFPRVDANNTVYYGGGRLYKAAGDIVRVYARKGDRKDKRIRFTDTASLKEAWTKACHVIVNDPRPVQ